MLFRSDPGSLRGIRGIGANGAFDLDADHPEDPEDLAALRVHLGAFGVVTHVRLAVSRGARIEVETVDAPLDAVPDPEVRASAPQVEAWWLPGGDRVLLTRRRPTEFPLTVQDHRALARHRLWGEDLPLTLVTTLARFAPLPSPLVNATTRPAPLPSRIVAAPTPTTLTSAPP